MKKFVLIVQYVSGEVTMLTSTPDLLEALQEFKKKLYEDTFNNDKGCPMPEIKSARILPLWYESIYKKEN